MSNEVSGSNPARKPAATPGLPSVDPSAASAGFSLPPDLLASLLADGDEQLVAWTLRNAIAERGRAVAYDELLTSAMRLIGERWVAGQWGIAEEHLASQTIIHALDSVRPQPVTDPTAPLAILAGVAGERHGIGLVCLAHVLEEAGWSVANLGADVPAADIAAFARKQDARLVAIAASLDERLPVLTETVTAVRAATAGTARPVRIIVGGRIAADPGIGARLGVDWAGASLAAAIEVLARMRRTPEPS